METLVFHHAINSIIATHLTKLATAMESTYQGCDLESTAIEWSIDLHNGVTLTKNGFTLKSLTAPIPTINLDSDSMSLTLKVGMDFFVSYDPFDSAFIKFQGQHSLHGQGLLSLVKEVGQLDTSSYAVMLDKHYSSEQGLNYGNKTYVMDALSR